MEYKDLEKELRNEAAEIAGKGESWPAERVSEKLKAIATILAAIRRQHESGIDASMGKRSGSKIEI